MMGTMFCNLCLLSGDLMEKTDRWTSPLFALFFVISGAELELGVFSDLAIVGIGLVYILMRCLGKYLGASLPARAMKLHPNIVKYLGITLFPQAGVALGIGLVNRMKPGNRTAPLYWTRECDYVNRFLALGWVPCPYWNEL